MGIQTAVSIDRINVGEELPKYQAWITQILRRHGCPDPENAAGDVVCVVWTLVTEKGETLRDPAAYIAKVCFNCAREHRRKRANLEQQMPATLQPMSTTPNYDLMLDIEAAMRRLKLGERDRQLLDEGETPREELAERFGTTVGAVTTRLKRLRKKLADAVAQSEERHAGRYK